MEDLARPGGTVGVERLVSLVLPSSSSEACLECVRDSKPGGTGGVDWRRSLLERRSRDCWRLGGPRGGNSASSVIKVLVWVSSNRCSVSKLRCGGGSSGMHGGSASSSSSS